MGVFSPGLPGGDFFRRALTTIVVSLIAVCAVLVALSFVQGPKLQSAIVDPERVVTAPSQQLRLFANQALSEVDPEQVEISPAAPFTVSVENDIIQIQFTGLLSFDTDYTVTVTVTGGHESVPGPRGRVPARVHDGHRGIHLPRSGRSSAAGAARPHRRHRRQWR
ncbi:hypothetical protein ABIB15_001387 [Marisediminicola sp. UYEF4]|uniref:hypothetical protein n=1 Tax=Marisediminicola sp. UYEF4 TaxID=1756384 RepID=UPI00339AA49B